jgi:hypothetical protein
MGVEAEASGPWSSTTSGSGVDSLNPPREPARARVCVWCVWMCVGVCGCLWVCVGVCGCVCAVLCCAVLFPPVFVSSWVHIVNDVSGTWSKGRRCAATGGHCKDNKRRHRGTIHHESDSLEGAPACAMVRETKPTSSSAPD